MAELPQGAVWVRLPRFLGDGILMHQAVAPLRAAGLPLVAWGPKGLVDLFDGAEGWAGVCADPEKKPKALEMARTLRAHRPRALVSLPRTTRPLMAGFLARVPLRVSWREAGGFLLATVSDPFKSQSIHQLDRYRNLVRRAFPGLPEGEDAPLRPRPEAMAAGEQALAGLGIQGPFVALALGGMALNKRLGTPVWASLVRRLRKEGVAHVLLGGKGEDESQARDLLALEPGIPSLVGALPLSATAGVVARAAALVGNDSATSHLAAACHTPAIVVFGPTRPEVTAPVGPAVTLVRRDDLPCLPCMRWDCTVEGHPCMQAVDPERLWDAIRPHVG